MNIKPIRTKKDHERAIRRIEKLWDAKPHSPQGDECEILVTLVEAYEEKHYPIAPPHPVEAIKFQMEQLGMTDADLAKYVGSRSRVSEIFSGKRRLTVGMMKRLHNQMGVPAESLLAD